MTGSTIEFGQGEGALRAISQRVEEARATFEKHAAELDSQIQSLRGTWVGDGGSAFTILHTAWIEKHAGVTAALDRFQTALTATEADNVAVDQAVSAELGRLHARLGQLA